MKILSWNVNGLRAVLKKGFLKWLKKEKPDILCLQEIKIQNEQLPEKLQSLKQYFPIYNFAYKKGYSGVVVLTKKEPLGAEFSLGNERFDQEGRIIKLQFPEFLLINLYLPQGGREKENMSYKLKIYNQLLKYLKKIPAKGWSASGGKNQKVVLVGDFNIAHTELDLARPKNNLKNTMFTPEERQKISRILDLGFVDSFRKFNHSGGNYTWWPYYLNARGRNIGWRIDYLFVSKLLRSQIKKAFILKAVLGSDHCPIGIEINS